MKKLLLIFIMMPILAVAQTREDYEKAMEQFMQYYNNGQTDEICKFIVGSKYECFWKRFVEYEDPIPKYGKIKSFRYMGKVTKDPNDIVAFKVIYDKIGTKAMSFHLDENLKFGTFRFITTDDEIEEMLANTP